MPAISPEDLQALRDAGIHPLRLEARRMLRDAGIRTGKYVRSWNADGVWRGDICGCPDDRCIGHHHDAEDECGCLRSILDERQKNAPPELSRAPRSTTPTPPKEKEP